MVKLDSLVLQSTVNYATSHTNLLVEVARTTGHIKECVISKQQKSTANAEETSMKIPKIKQQTLSGFIKRQKSVDHQVIQSQSDSKSEISYQNYDLDHQEANIPEESELNPQECKEVVSNLELMEKKKVIDDGLKQKITCLC